MIRERRIRFYQRNGSQLLTRIEFKAPPLADDLPPVRYFLMFRPVDPEHGTLTQPELRAIVETVLLHGYELQPNDPYFLQALTSLQQSS
jgi:hypothetical protein